MERMVANAKSRNSPCKMVSPLDNVHGADQRLFERQPIISERAKWQYSLLASHQIGSTIMPPRESYIPDATPTISEHLQGTLYVNLLDVGDQTAKRRNGLLDRLCDMLVALYKTSPESFPNGDYLEDTERWLDEGSELGEEPTL
jgi:hypothetical protein